MAFEYSHPPEPASPVNPLRVENHFLLVTAAVLAAIAVGVLLVVRHHADADLWRLARGTLTAVSLLGLSLATAGFAMAHLTHLAGRTGPPDLPDGHRMAEQLRRRVLDPPVPAGPLNGLLYAWVERLIFAPQPLQRLAQLQFSNGLTLLAILASLILTTTLGRAGVSASAWLGLSSWVGMGFLVMAAYLLTWMSPWRLTRRRVLPSYRSLAILIAFTIVGPVVLVLVGVGLPPQTWVSVYPGVFLVLAAAAVVHGLFFHALMGQLPVQRHTDVSFLQQAWTLRGPPEQLLQELDRVLHERGIPGRRYLWQEPVIHLSGRSGRFSGLALEEEPPRPLLREPVTLAGAWADPTQRRLVHLDIAGCLLTILGGGLLALHATRPSIGPFDGTWLAYGLLFEILGAFAFLAGHLLWERLDFESLIVMLSLEGSFTAGALQHRSGTFRTRSEVVQIESMTVRLWVSRLHTVTMGDGKREVAQMTGEGAFAAGLMQRLHGFAQSQAIVLAPSSREDLARAVQLGQMDRAVRGACGAGVYPQAWRPMARQGRPPCRQSEQQASLRGGAGAVLPGGEDRGQAAIGSSH